MKEATLRLGEAIGEVRSISHGLRSSLLDTLGLPAAIGQLSEEFKQRSGLTVTFEANEFECLLDEGVPISLFRIVQEALSNIERHALAKNVSITLYGTKQSVRLTIVDDGIGFNVAKVERRHSGIGLRNIRERVEHFGGELQLVSIPGRSELDITIPMSMPCTEI